MLPKNENQKITKHEFFFIILCFCIYAFWAIFFSQTNIFYGPDEVSRYNVVMYITDNHSLPTGWESELIIPLWGFSYALDLKLPYLLSALFVSIISLITDSSIAQLIAFKFVSVLSGTGVAFFSILIAKKITKSDIGKWIFVFSMSLIPQVIFISSYFNLDIFSLFTVMIIIDSWLNGYSDNWSIYSTIELGIGMGLCLVSYSFAYGYLVGSFFLYIFWYLNNKQYTLFSTFVKKGLIMLLIVLSISGWMFIRNYLVHDGDIFAVNARFIQSEIYAEPEYKISNSLKAHGISILDMLLHTNFIELSYRSLICVLGHMAIRGSIVLYAFYTFLLILGFVSFINADKPPAIISVLSFGIVSAIITVILSVYYSWSVDYEPQGRYIITILPIVFLTASIGLESLITKCLPSKNQKNCVLVICLLIVFFSLEAFIRCARYFGFF